MFIKNFKIIPMIKITVQIVGLAVLMISLTTADFGQTSTEGATPKMTQPGAPAGSYSLSGFESVNLFNGNLNFTLPLAKIGGRGKAAAQINLSIDSARWELERDGRDQNSNGEGPRVRFQAGIFEQLEIGPAQAEACANNNNTDTLPTFDTCLRDLQTLGEFQNPFAFFPGVSIASGVFYESYAIREKSEPRPGYGPGLMFARKGAMWNTHLTRVYFIAPDGTEYELRDEITDGKPIYHLSGNWASRGQVFLSQDGSGLRFVSNEAINDNITCCASANFDNSAKVSGTLYFPDGTKYVIADSNVTLIRDINGNKITYAYDQQNRVTNIVDSLGRQIIISYNNNAEDPNDTDLIFDEIKTQKSETGWQILRIFKTKLQNALRDGFDLMTYGEMFEDIPLYYEGNVEYNPSNVVTKVQLPDGRSYRLSYTPYNEIARVELPTGGAIEYEFPIANIYPTGLQVSSILRPVVERTIYANGGSSFAQNTYDGRQRYFRENAPPGSSWAGSKILVEECKGAADSEDCEVNTKTDHYFYGTATQISHGFYSQWNLGREYKTELSTASNTLKARTENEWIKPVNVSWNGPNVGKKISLKSVTSTIFEGTQSLTSKVVYGYDHNSATNNKTDEWVFNYGVGAPGRLIKHSKTTHLVINEHHNNVDYTLPSVYLLGLPRSKELYDVSYTGAETLVAKSEFLYDEVTTDRAPLGYGLTSLTGWENPDPDNKPFEMRNIRGTATTNRVWRDTDNSWVETHSQLDQLGNPRKAWDAAGNLSQILYDPQYLYAYPTSAITPVPDPTGAHGSNTAFVTTTEYDFYTAQVKKVIDANGQQTLTEYNDILQRPTKVIAPNGQQTIFEYGDAPSDLFVRVKTQIDEINWDEATTYFDGLGRGTRKKSKDSQGDVSVDTGYDGLGRVEKVSNPYRSNEDLLWTHTTYDELGRIIKVKTPDNAEVTSAYSLATGGVSIGSVVTVTDQALKLKRSITNVLGQLVQVDEPGSANTLDPLPSATPAPTPGPGPTPDPTPDPTPTPGPGGCGESGQSTCTPELTASYSMASTYYQYDGRGNLQKVIQGEQTRTFISNSLGQLLSATNPESGTITYAYDNNGNISNKTDERNISVAYVYDVRGRVINKTYSDSTPEINYFYDNQNGAKGQLTKVSNSVSTTEFTAFDVMGKVLSHKQITSGQTFNTFYKYNLSGVLIEETYPSGEVIRNFLQSDGNLDRVAVSGRTYASDFEFTSSGAVSSMKLGNGDWENTNFNSRLQPLQISLGTTKGAKNLLQLDFSYGTIQNNENLLSQTITVPAVGQTPGFSAVQTYSYDSLNRLKEAREMIGTTESWKQTFSYDRYGNRRFDSSPDRTTTLEANCPTAICNPEIDTKNNRLIGADYDSAGNTLSTPASQEYVYDAENKIVQAKAASGNVLGIYWYDGEGKRVRKEVPNGETTIFVYNAARVLIAEYSSQTNPTPQLAFLTSDHLGSPRINTDAHGAVSSRHDYHPFGEEVFSPERSQVNGYRPDSIRKQFTGYERDDETSLDFAEARYYNNDQARFMSADMLLASCRPINPSTWNRYSYVLNNPLKLVDPSGFVDEPPQPQPQTKKRILYIFVGISKEEQEDIQSVTTTITQGKKTIDKKVSPLKVVSAPDFQGLQKKAPEDLEVKVITGQEGTLEAFQKALQDENAAGVIFIGHGAGSDDRFGVFRAQGILTPDGGIYTSDNSVDVKAALVGVFGCNTLDAASIFQGKSNAVIAMNGGKDGLSTLPSMAQAGYAAALAVVQGKTPDQVTAQANVAFTKGGGAHTFKINGSSVTFAAQKRDAGDKVVQFK